jgi:predicted nucleic acid-binding protein
VPSVAYLDTSALVKLYAPEVGSEQVQTLIEETGTVVSSVLAYPEARGVFARLLHRGEATQKQYEDLVDAFEEDWRTVVKVQLGEAVYRRAGDLLAAHPRLRALDAVHMSSALDAQAHVGVLFMTFDHELQEVAERLMPGRVRPG